MIEKPEYIKEILAAGYASWNASKEQREAESQKRNRESIEAKQKEKQRIRGMLYPVADK